MQQSQDTQITRAVSRQRLGKHISAAKTEAMLETGFSTMVRAEES
jgi:hypothetical protein